MTTTLGNFLFVLSFILYIVVDDKELVTFIIIIFIVYYFIHRIFKSGGTTAEEIRVQEREEESREKIYEQLEEQKNQKFLEKKQMLEERVRRAKGKDKEDANGLDNPTFLRQEIPSEIIFEPSLSFGNLDSPTYKRDNDDKKELDTDSELSPIPISTEGLDLPSFKRAEDDKKELNTEAEAVKEETISKSPKMTLLRVSESSEKNVIDLDDPTFQRNGFLSYQIHKSKPIDIDEENQSVANNTNFTKEN